MTGEMGRTLFLRTGRLGFGYWTREDLPLAMALWGDPLVTRLFGGPFDERQVRERLEREITNQSRHGFQYWPLFHLGNGEHVGCAGLRPCERPGTLELGFHLRPPFWRAGFGSEAARAIIAHAFDVLGAGALLAGHHPENEPSRALLRRLGFQSIGAEFYEPTGEMHPSYLLQNDQA